MIWIVALLSCIGLIGAETPFNLRAHNERVIGGQESPPNIWTWQVSLQENLYDDGLHYHICGGSLIDAFHILTAAHCTGSDASRYRVVVGEYNLYEYDGSEQFIDVEKVIVHPGWTGDLTIGNDIAVMKLTKPVYNNGFVSIGIIPTHDDSLTHGFSCYITGWGLMDDKGGAPAILQEAPITVVEHSVCSQPEWWGSYIKETMLCAGGDGFVSGCMGDSGGPLSCFSEGDWQIHGVVSYGPSGGCNQKYKPTVFTRVSKFHDWIYSVMKY